MYFLALGSTVFLAPYLWWTRGIKKIRIEMQGKVGNIITAGLLMFFAYALVLLALQFSRVSYIAPAREVGIVIGVLLGIIILREPFGKGRILGSCLIVIGLTLISLAP
jgi:drug/metabolite transporter (DMT)-like permease